MIQTKFLPPPITYDGSQLRSHWIFENTELLGNALVAFTGPCHVIADHMVDLIDKSNAAWIHSDAMVHFIAEFFDHDLEKTILRQHLFVSIIADIIRELAPDVTLTRKGNDLYRDKYKFNVSIATASPISTLIHIGVNISSHNTPVDAVGLDDIHIDVPQFISNAIGRFTSEMERVEQSRYKVKAVN